MSGVQQHCAHQTLGRALNYWRASSRGLSCWIGAVSLA